MITIYLIFNSLNGKGYLGQTIKSARHRLINHLSQAKRGSPLPLHRAMRKYGADAFELHEIGVCTSRDQANRFERNLIISLRRHVAGCYNLSGGGQGLWNPTEDVRRRMGAAIHEARMRRSHASNERILELYKTGISAKAVAKEVGLTDGAIRFRLKSMGVSIRGLSEYSHKQSDEVKNKIRQARLRWWKSPQGLVRREEMCRQQAGKMFPTKR